MFTEIKNLAMPQVEIITSPFCYETKIKWRGVADARKPNTRRPLYVRTVVRKPTAYRVGNKLVCHPDILARLQKAAQESVTTKLEAEIIKAFSRPFSEPPAPFAPMIYEPEPDPLAFRFQHRYGWNVYAPGNGVVNISGIS